MPTLAIVGAGPGMGLAIARIFGAHGFEVALIARNREKLDGLTAAFAADLRDRDALTQALKNAATHFGGIDVLEYSPAVHTPGPGFTMTTPSQTTVADLEQQLEFNLYGALTATRAVLPAMREAGA